jgi:hypothetical protein
VNTRLGRLLYLPLRASDAAAAVHTCRLVRKNCDTSLYRREIQDKSSHPSTLTDNTLGGE